MGDINQHRREDREKANPGPGPGEKYGGLYQDRVPRCNFMGEKNDVNSGQVMFGYLMDIQVRDVLEIFVFLGL